MKKDAAVARLIDGAAEFARCYVKLAHELMAAGVEEPIAREEARCAALTAVVWDEEEEREAWQR